MPDLKMFYCLCGARLVGVEADYEQHLETECPVYSYAHRLLSRIDK